MNIYTYHVPVENLPYQHLLLPLWQERWRAQGWEPVVLTEEQARLHPLYNAMDAHFKAHLPTVNPPLYERACFLRWLAMAMQGGGWMCDSDVMPYDFKPSDYQAPRDLIIWSTGNPCPCLVSGSSSEYERIVSDVFLEWTGPTEHINGRPHSSDQGVLQQNRDAYLQMKICAQYGEPNWEHAPVVHYPNGSMNGKQPRAEWIPKLR